MNLFLEKSTLINGGHIALSGSKSESNRLLLLQKLYGNIDLENISNSEDTIRMQKALTLESDVIDIHHAGTAMRFLTAYFATQTTRSVVLTGSARMKERPIEVLVKALQELGANIRYLQEKGFPPLLINGAEVQGGALTLPATISSQYISALLLVAPKMVNGLELHLEGTITSRPYIEMTLSVLEELGIKTSFQGNVICVSPQIAVDTHTFVIESDWSSASYFYAIIALSPIGTYLTLSSFKETSLQGDSQLIFLFKAFGVETVFGSSGQITISKVKKENASFSANLIDTPDLAQTLAVVCFGLQISSHLTGLHTLKVKETDRLEALNTELSKLGAVIEVTDSELKLEAAQLIRENISIETYNDHRMALAFAPLALLVPIEILEAEVVSKSYGTYWKDLESLGFKLLKKQ